MSQMPLDPSMMRAGAGLDAALQANAASAAKPKAGMFGAKGTAIAEALLGALNGYLAGTGNPVGMEGLRAMQQRRTDAYNAQREDGQYQQHRSDALEDWKSQQMFKMEHPESRAPHYFESNSGDQYTIGPDGKPQEVFHDPMRYKFVPNGMGGVVPVDIGALMGGQMPQKPVGKLTPLDDGGPGLGAPGGFPRPY